MKKFGVLILVAVFAAVCLATWYKVIQPQNTRLAFYELKTTSKLNRGTTADQVTAWRDELQGVNISHLKPCEQIQYFNHNAALQRRSNSLDVDPAMLPTSLQKAAQRYLTETPTLEALSKIGEAEFEKVMTEIRLLEDQLSSEGKNITLDELAAQPKNFSSDPEEIAAIYNRYISKGEQSFKSRFYDYDIPKGTTYVVKFSNRLNAYASYDGERNAMKAYFDAAQYDVSVAPFISIHEIFPGHHLSAKAGLSRPICAGDAPAMVASWLGEGWATYVEFLGDEDGFFETPEDKLAWLDYRLTRAMRIILDVKKMQGAYQRDAQRLIWDKRMPSRLSGRFDREYNRLSAARHRHLSYILGYNHIAKTKVQLKKNLGPDFDEKKFHDAILRLQHREAAALYDTVRVAMEISGEPGNLAEN